MNHSTKVARIKARLKKAGIRRADVAAAAGVGPTCVSHVLSGRVKSANVISAAERLLLAAKKERAA